MPDESQPAGEWGPEEEDHYFVLDQNITYPAVPWSDVRDWVREGYLSPAAMVCREGATQWQAVKDVEGLADVEGFKQWMRGASGRLRQEFPIDGRTARHALKLCGYDSHLARRVLSQPDPRIERPLDGSEASIDRMFCRPQGGWSNWGVFAACFVLFAPAGLIVGLPAVWRGKRWTTRWWGKWYCLMGAVGFVSLGLYALLKWMEYQA
ncbi:MAG: hypothetical protein GF320_19615 [Armatimonadia bacterium]|nr:hypothetical protein [Armatimonadia bacterium]